MPSATLRTHNSYELFPDNLDAQDDAATALAADSRKPKTQGGEFARSVDIPDSQVIEIDRHEERAAGPHSFRTRKSAPRKQAGGMVSNGTIGRRLLNVREAAQYLDLEVDTVYRKSRLREVPSVKVDRALKFDVAALDRYIEQHTIEAID